MPPCAGPSRMSKLASEEPLAAGCTNVRSTQASPARKHRLYRLTVGASRLQVRRLRTSGARSASRNWRLTCRSASPIPELAEELALLRPRQHLFCPRIMCRNLAGLPPLGTGSSIVAARLGFRGRFTASRKRERRGWLMLGRQTGRSRPVLPTPTRRKLRPTPNLQIARSWPTAASKSSANCPTFPSRWANKRNNL